MNYFVEESYLNTHTAGSKPRNDFNEILGTMKMKSIHKNGLDNKIYFQEDDVVFFQYPFLDSIQKSFFERCVDLKIRVVLIIHDISHLQSGSKQMNSDEIRIFNLAYYLICHNDAMNQWLKNNQIVTPIVELKVFDYLVSDYIYNLIPKRVLKNEIIFAGNLEPRIRSFLYDPSFNHKFKLNLYGPGFSERFETQNMEYYGSFHPDIIPMYLEGSFGLIWNGDSYLTCKGNLEFYSTIITSHKLSLYLVSKIPIICWEKSWEANFVIENNIGFTVGSLSEVDEKLSKITDKEYYSMVKNISFFCKKLKEGWYLKNAICKIKI